MSDGDRFFCEECFWKGTVSTLDTGREDGELEFCPKCGEWGLVNRG